MTRKKAIINSFIEFIFLLIVDVLSTFKNARKRRLIRRANKLAMLTGYKYLVLVFAGKLKLYRRKDLKQVLNARVSGKRIFKKGTTIQNIEKNAIYVTL